jgi:tRNA(Ile)-lysidine synthase
VEALAARLRTGETFAATLCGAGLEARGGEVVIGREAGRAGLPHVPVTPGWVGVWDGRFEVEADEVGILRPLKGLLNRLAPLERAALKPVPAWQRPTLPVLQTPDGALRTVRKRCLVQGRLLAACGAYARERELPAP